MRTIYAIRQSSKGWSDIIAVVDTKELAKELHKTGKNIGKRQIAKLTSE